MIRKSRYLFHENPLCLVLLLYAAGIVGARYCPLPDAFNPLWLLSIPVCLIPVMLLPVRFAAEVRQIGIFLVLFVLGYFASAVALGHHTLPAGKKKFTGLALSDTRKKASGWELDVLVTPEIHSSEKVSEERTARVRIFYASDSIRTEVLPGDSVFFTGRLQPVMNRALPGEFRYADFLKNHGIWYTAYLREGDLSFRENPGSFPLRRLGSKIQKMMIGKFSEFGIRGSELAVVAALAAGETMLVDDEQRSSFSDAGAMHVLAVSGLHVGILYLFLQLVLFNGIQVPWVRWTRFIIILLALWTYALVTGLSPSVVRAASMFTLFHLGKSFKRSASGLNILAAAAIILLSVDPLQLFHSGFQLSFLAVAGILIFQPVLENILQPDIPILKRIWQLLTVSLAVQFTTLPLTLFLFRQFPNWFLLTNLLVIPLVWLIMVLIILFFLTLPVVPLAGIIANALNALLHFFLSVVDKIAGLPAAVTDGIRFGTVHVVGWYLVIVVIIHGIYRRRVRSAVQWGVAIVIVLFVFDMVSYSYHENRSELVVYRSAPLNFMSLVEGHNQVLLAFGTDTIEEKNGMRYIEPFLIQRQWETCLRLTEPEHLRPGAEISSGKTSIISFRTGICLQTGEYRFFLLRSNKGNGKVELPNFIDILIADRLSGYPGEDLSIPKSCRQIILCNNQNTSQKRAWIRYCEQKNMAWFSVRDEGAYLLSRYSKSTLHPEKRN